MYKVQSIVSEKVKFNDNGLNRSFKNDHSKYGKIKSDLEAIHRNNMSSEWNASGWIRIYCGTARNEMDDDDQSRMVHVDFNSNTEDVVRNMNLPLEYTLWVQIGGSHHQRLNFNEQPFKILEKFLTKTGFNDKSRRLRLCIDPDLKYLIRFFIGPSTIPEYIGVKTSGSVEILKGLVFSQWYRRCICVIGSKLIIISANSYKQNEIFEIAGAEIYKHTAHYDRLILQIVPKSGGSVSNLNEHYNLIKCGASVNVSNCYENNNIIRSSNSVGSLNSQCERDKMLFLGFETTWEQDLWSDWLLEATNQICDNKRLDICSSGLQAFPEIILKSHKSVEELLAGHNKLQEIGLNALVNFTNLKILRLPDNNFKIFPKKILELRNLRILDLGNNNIDAIPYEIYKLENLEELFLERNEITHIHERLGTLENLRNLNLSYNKIESLPKFLINKQNMRLLDMYSQKVNYCNEDNNNNNNKTFVSNKYQQVQKQKSSNGLINKINLRSNELKGSIILGNYGFLTQLDVSENHIEILDLSALDKLENLQCCRNKLTDLTVNGRCLTSLIAGNNCLKKLSVFPTPVNLRHLDVSFNELSELPDWLNGCIQLKTMFANNNKLLSLPDHLFCSEHSSLQTLQLGYNRLKLLPIMPRRTLPLEQLFLQNNEILELPENFFYSCRNLILLNISSNRILVLPSILKSNENNQTLSFCLEKLYLTNNNLTDRIFDLIINFNNIRILHLGYNRLTSIPETCSKDWPELEELILSGNKLQVLPSSLTNLSYLKILRVHSNRLESVPMLSKVQTLKVLDLAHNQLDKINLVSLVPKKLQFLDLSWNRELQVDPHQLQACRSERRMSLIDVSGKNRASLPSAPSKNQEILDFEPPWKVGFAETSGNLSKLFISQLRLSTFCSTEALFGLFDGDKNSTVPNVLVKVIPKILLEERTVKETSKEYMKYTMLSAHRELKQYGQKNGVCATICHISRNRNKSDLHGDGIENYGGKKYWLRIASVGEATSYLVRNSGYVKLNSSNPDKKLGNSSNYPVTIPDPEISEIELHDHDEFLIIGNKNLWNVMDIETIITEIRKEEKAILAAKRIQDVAQSYGAEENLSILVVKFNNLGTDVDSLMRELRQTIKKKPNSTTLSGFCKCGCCCETNNSCCHSGVTAQFIRQPSGVSDRSSPSGQSDQTASELQSQLSRQRLIDSTTIASRRSHSTYASNERKSLRGGVVRAVRAKIEEEREKDKEAESDSAMSEEQFKCWEYMLEQNTQLLFDKELNTISKGFTKRTPLNINSQHNASSNLGEKQLKSLSISSPQLTYNNKSSENNIVSSNVSRSQTNGNVPFLSKHFGSARSFNPHSSSFFKPIRFNSNRGQSTTSISYGPNAAYFGSLQRLMPYNLEYDFAVIHERNMNESLDPDNRMHQYWGIATTEL